MTKSINCLLKVTNSCNLRCGYCFHADSGYSRDFIDINLVRKFLSLASAEYDCVNIIFHGGEPLLAPLSFFQDVVEASLQLDARFSFSLQTNGVLLNRSSMQSLSDMGIHIGISFDGLANEELRGRTSTILENLSNVSSMGMKVGALCVVSDLNKYSLLDQYHFFNSIPLSVKFNPLFPQGAAFDNNMQKFDYEQYSSQYLNLFRLWLCDPECRIGIDNFYEVIDAIEYNTLRNCIYTSCLGRWLCIDPSGKVYPCDRLSGQSEYFMGSIDSIRSINDLFHAHSFVSLLREAVKRKRYCLDHCEVYRWCNSGCNSEAILSRNAAYPNLDACNFRRRVLLELATDVHRICSQYSSNPKSIRNIQLRSFLYAKSRIHTIS